MRSTRTTATVSAALLSLALLGGCGGDEPGETEEPTGVATEEQRGECEAKVKVTGAVKAAWKGEAFVVTENRSGPTVYKSVEGKNSLTLLAADGDVPALASLSTKKGGFSGADGTMEVDPKGSGATVESTLSAGAGKSADLAATITC